jgi:hypothetical protein
MPRLADELCELCGKEPWAEFIGVPQAGLPERMKAGYFACAKCAADATTKIAQPSDDGSK